MIWVIWSQYGPITNECLCRCEKKLTKNSEQKSCFEKVFSKTFFNKITSKFCPLSAQPSQIGHVWTLWEVLDYLKFAKYAATFSELAASRFNSAPKGFMETLLESPPGLETPLSSKSKLTQLGNCIIIKITLIPTWLRNRYIVYFLVLFKDIASPIFPRQRTCVCRSIVYNCISIDWVLDGGMRVMGVWVGMSM